MNIFHDKFTTGQVLEASGASNAALQSWLKRGAVIGRNEDPIEGGSRPGIHRRYSFFNVMQIVAAKGLIDLGVTVDHAFLAAGAYAHTGDVELGRHPDRAPGFPFSTRNTLGLTLLCVASTNYNIYFSPLRENPIPSVMHVLGGAEGFTALVMNDVFERAVQALGYDPNKLLSETYRPAGSA